MCIYMYIYTYTYLYLSIFYMCSVCILNIRSPRSSELARLCRRRAGDAAAVCVGVGDNGAAPHGVTVLRGGGGGDM